MKRKPLIIISIILFLLILLLYKMDLIFDIDTFAYNCIIYFKNDYITNIMKFITFFGSAKFIIILMILFTIISFKYNKKLLIFDLIVTVEVILNNLIKIIVSRQRPTLINLVEENSYSFPSGHTMVSIVVYGFLIYLIKQSKLSNKQKKYIQIFLITLIVLIMVSRIYLGAHYFSDVIAGLFLALSYLLFNIEIIERKKLL